MQSTVPVAHGLSRAPATRLPACPYRLPLVSPLCVGALKQRDRPSETGAENNHARLYEPPDTQCCVPCEYALDRVCLVFVTVI